MTGLYITIIASVVGIVSWFLIGRVRFYLLKFQLIDHPNERSSHTKATTHGAGIGVLAVLLPVWIFITFLLPPQSQAEEMSRWIIPGLTLLLATISFLDDIRGLSQFTRLLMHAGAIITAVQLLPGPVFTSFLYPALDIFLITIGWIWFMNLFNFMDGIDGISGVETIAIAIGIYAIGAVFMPYSASYGQNLVIAAAMAGFLVWNWSPAKIFLGDVGSIPLGFLIGWHLLDLTANGFWEAAVILPLYYITDSSLTLIRRFLSGQSIWKAHREHFYQVAVQKGWAHSTVARAIALTNVLLVILAFFSAYPQLPVFISWLILLSACLVVALLIVWMLYGRDNKTDKTDQPKNNEYV